VIYLLSPINEKEERMNNEELIKNIPFSQAVDIESLVDYETGRVVSRTLANKPTLGLTLFAFDAGEGISAHSAPGDAMVQILDGEALINVGGKDIKALKGQVVVMPADVPHSLHALTPFKMLLIVVKRPAGIKGMM
jgi:quercetin dioxygenase-like cupin family protein